DLVYALADGWGLSAETLRYAPVGGGSYHWVVTSGPGEQWFVTVDDLDDKGWLGRTRPAGFAGLRAAVDASVTLRRRGGRRVRAACGSWRPRFRRGTASPCGHSATRIRSRCSRSCTDLEASGISP